MRVIQSCGSRSWGGLEMQTLKTALGLKERGLDVILFCAKGSRLESEGIKNHLVVRPVFDAEGKTFPSIKKTQAFLKNFPVDVIHTHLSHDLQMLVPAMQVTKSEARLFLTKRIASGVKKKDLLHRYLYHRLERIFAISSYIRQSVLNTCPVPEEKVELLHNGIDLNLFDPKMYDREAIRKEIGLNAESIVIGMAGRFSPGKGHREFFLAAKMIMENVKQQVQFFVVGGPSYGEEEYYRQIVNLAKKIINNQSLVLTGFRSDMARMMKAMDVLAFPSREESLGNIVLESMAMGVPVVACRSGGVPDIILDGETGYLVPPGHVEPLAEKLMQYIQSAELRKRHGTEGRKRIKAKFNFKTYLDTLIRYYSL
jgi:glycosyltransferase involved in cell wall biosynthesis